MALLLENLRSPRRTDGFQAGFASYCLIVRRDAEVLSFFATPSITILEPLPSEVNHSLGGFVFHTLVIQPFLFWVN